jgi:hypothetical protein
MTYDNHLAILKQGVEVWNRWRNENPTIQPHLGGAILFGEILNNVDLRRASLQGAMLGEAILEGADFSEADLSRAHLGRAYLRGASLSSAALMMANFFGANLSGANLVGAHLGGAHLDGADLSRADLGQANLSGTNLSGTNLSGASLEAATIGGTRFGNLDLSAVKGLETVQHKSPSTIGIDTLYKSRGKIPEVFLRGCGVPDRMIVFIASLAGQPETYRVRLRMMIDEHLNKSELQTLCFDMNVDYDSLNGENKSDKARELVAYFQRRGTIRDLVAKCKELRPKVEWESE